MSRLSSFVRRYSFRIPTIVAVCCLLLVLPPFWTSQTKSPSSKPDLESTAALKPINPTSMNQAFGIVLTPISGWTADRLDRRHIARAVLGLECFCAIILFVATWEGWISLPILFGVAALLGVARAFAGPALGALAPNLVPREILPTAIALSSAAWQTGAIAGPAIGGILYDFEPYLPYAFSAVLFAFSTVCMFTIRPVERTALRPGSPLQQMANGLSYVRRNRLVLGAITLDLFAVLLGGATAIYFSFRPIRTNVGVKMLTAVVIFGAATAVFGFSTSFWLSLAALTVLGGQVVSQGKGHRIGRRAH